MAKESVLISITQFTPFLKDLPKPGKRAKVRIYCNNCGRHHHLRWGEFQNSLHLENVVKRRHHYPGRGHPPPASLQDIIDIYAFKYCVDRSGNGYSSQEKQPGP